VARLKRRRATEPERQITEALAELFEELEVDPDDADWLALHGDVREVFFDLGKAVAATLVERMPAAVEDLASTRCATEMDQMVRRNWGHIRRREVFARRRAGAVRAAVVTRRERMRRPGIRRT